MWQSYIYEPQYGDQAASTTVARGLQPSGSPPLFAILPDRVVSRIPPKAHDHTGPPAIDGIGATGSWDDYYRQADAARRNRAPWSAKAA